MADMDLEKFFDTVCQSKLIEVLSRTIKDGRVLSLIHKYLNAGIIRQGVFERSQQGVPQGGTLSPLPSNIMPFIEGKLFLKVNREKTSVAHISRVKYLGYGFYRYKGECRLKVHKKSQKKMMNRLREITQRSKAISKEERPRILKRFIKGWVNY